MEEVKGAIWVLPYITVCESSRGTMLPCNTYLFTDSSFLGCLVLNCSAEDLASQCPFVCSIKLQS